MNLAVGGNWPGNPDATTDFSKAEFEVNARSFRVTGKRFGEGVTLSLIVTAGEREALAALLQDLSGGKIEIKTVGETFAEDRAEP